MGEWRSGWGRLPGFPFLFISSSCASVPQAGGSVQRGTGFWGGEFPWARHTVDSAQSFCYWALGRVVRAQTSLPRG